VKRHVQQFVDETTRRSIRERYGLALLLTSAAMVIVSAGLAVSDTPIYAPLVAAVAVAAWFGGPGPAATSLVVGFLLAFGLLAAQHGELGNGEDVVLWAANFAVAALFVVVAGVLRIGRQRATDAAFEVERLLHRVEALQELSAELAGAMSSDEVSDALAERAAALLGAKGAALALIEGENVLVVGPIGDLHTELQVPARRTFLEDATLLTEALRKQRLVRADDRATLDREFPDSAVVMPPTVQSAIALPLRVAGEPVGVVEFLFDRPGAVDEELAAIASTAAGLAEQALERARLYERERETRTALDRILRVAPSFHAETTDEVTSAICQEARTTFGADYAVLWRIRDAELELVRSDPSRDEWPLGLRVPLRDFPGLARAVSNLGASFVRDVLEEARGGGLERVRRLGIRSSLRSPIVIGGNAELVLVVSWRSVVDEPDPATLAIVRRFADQAALAFEQLERRRAEGLAAARADVEQRLRLQTERVQRMTAGLSNALTQGDVAEIVVSAVLEATDAKTAIVYGIVDERQVLRPLASSASVGGVDGDAAEISLDDDSLSAQAARRGRAWQERPQTAAPEARTRLVSALVSGHRSVGVLDLSWDEPVTIDEDLAELLSTLGTLGAQALDRALHFESERSIAETLQRSVLPVALPQVDGVQLAARYLPGTQHVDVGGDWFDAVELPGDRLGLVVGDVVGKGVHAAASMSQLRNALRAFAAERLKPPSVLARLDRLADDTAETTFATVVYAVVDTAAEVLRFSSAGHPPPAVAYPDGRVELLEDGRGLPLGTGLRPKYRQSVVDLPAGSIVVLYSDGLVERRGRSIDDGIDALISAMEEAPKDAERLLEHVLDTLLEGVDRADDIALIAARFLPVAPRPLDLTVPSREDSLQLVRDALRTWLEGTQLSRADAEDLLLAAWEASANAIEHAASPLEDLVHVRATVDDARARILISDTGRFVPIAPRPHRGLGLRLAERLASSFQITTAGAGTTVSVEKEIPEAADSVETVS
jgi:GAF domain-containing protein/anti-sigma regulatory factor (Ser/Thr protein kinase)